MKLSKKFLAVVLTGGVMAGTVLHPDLDSRFLTEGEAEMLSEDFGQAVDYDRVTVSDNPFFPFLHSYSVTPNGHVYMPEHGQEDFSKAESAIDQGDFSHEMTHVWQHQNGIFIVVWEAFKLWLEHDFDYSQAYHYQLDDHKTLLDYNMEQQARIVEDYFYLRQEEYYLMSTCETKKTTKEKMKQDCQIDKKEKQYKKIIGDTLKNPLRPKIGPV